MADLGKWKEAGKGLSTEEIDAQLLKNKKLGLGMRERENPCSGQTSNIAL